MEFNDLPILSRIRLGFDIFLASAREKHGDRFLYDRSSWKNTQEKVRIYCGAHGWFSQQPYDHLRKSGCEACARQEMMRRKSQASLKKFLDKAAATHGGRYQYDPSSWRGHHSKVKIACPEHGWFEQIPRDHLRLSGCSKCGAIARGLDSRLSKRDVVSRFIAVHGDRYSYDNMVYEKTLVKVEIVCRQHGSFFQSVGEHLSGHGCQKCSKRHRWTTQEFIENSKSVHGDKFLYDRTQYTGALNKVIITCREHGDFHTQAARHVQRKDGCPQCNPVRLKTQDKFISECVSRFGDYYDYSLVEYINSSTPVKIMCRTHGVFEQPPSWHLNSAIGCPHCTHTVSIKETAWLDSLNLPKSAKRQARILLDGKRRSVDAFDPKSNTVYEFWGDWWHGHPSRFAPADIHPRAKVSYGELYAKTQAKRRAIRRAGYTLVEIWEHDYDEQVMARQCPPPPHRRHAPRRARVAAPKQGC